MTTVENWDVLLIHGKHGRSGANICTGNQVEGAIFPWIEWVGRSWMDGWMDGWMGKECMRMNGGHGNEIINH